MVDYFPREFLRNLNHGNTEWRISNISSYYTMLHSSWALIVSGLYWLALTTRIQEAVHATNMKRSKQTSDENPTPYLCSSLNTHISIESRLSRTFRNTLFWSIKLYILPHRIAERDCLSLRYGWSFQECEVKTWSYGCRLTSSCRHVQIYHHQWCGPRPVP